MLWLIEPHADDVFLSMHQHIVSEAIEPGGTIITVYGDLRRQREGAEYAHAVGMHHLTLGLKDAGGLGGVSEPIPAELLAAIEPGHVVFLPIGLQHPDHRTVAALKFRSGVVIMRYLDAPYFAKQKLAAELDELVFYKHVYRMRATGKKKWIHTKHFKSQSMFFYYNTPETLPKLEVTFYD